MGDVVGTVRVERYYPHSRERVWRAMTRPDAVARWLAPGDFRAAVGHRFVLDTPPVAAAGFDGRVRCEVLVVDAPSQLTLRWEGGPVRSVVRLELVDEGPGTRLIVRHGGLGHPRSLAGWWAPRWEVHLAGLGEELSGGAPGGPAVAAAGAAAALLGVGLWVMLSSPSAEASLRPAPEPGPAPVELADRASEVSGASHAGRRGGSLIVYDEALPSTLNPLFARTMADHRAHELVFDRLFERDVTTRAWTSAVVEQHEVVDDRRRVVLALRDDAGWHDGRPLVADDVCFTIGALLDPATPATVAAPVRAAVLDCAAGPDGREVVIDLVAPMPDPREALSFHVLPAHLFTSTVVSPSHGFAVRPVGSGPMTARLEGREVRFRRATSTHHDARIDTVVVREMGDPEVAARTLVAGGVDGIASVPPSVRALLEAEDGVQVRAYDLRQWWYLALDPSHPALARPAVRAALDVALDRDALLVSGVGLPADSAAAAPISGPFLPESPLGDRTIPPAEADPVRVHRWMTGAGARLQGDRWVLDGEPVAFDLAVVHDVARQAPELADVLAEQLRAHGFEVRTWRIDDDALHGLRADGQLGRRYDLILASHEVAPGRDARVSSLFRTPIGPAHQNWFWFSDAAVDAALDRLEAAPTGSSQQQAAHALHATLAEVRPVLFLWRLHGATAWSNRVHEQRIAPYVLYSGFERWWLSDTSRSPAM